MTVTVREIVARMSFWQRLDFAVRVVWRVLVRKTL